MKPAPPTIRLALISLVTLAGALWLYIKGPIPIIRGTTALDEISCRSKGLSFRQLMAFLCRNREGFDLLSILLPCYDTA
jgi:hypothetical protein